MKRRVFLGAVLAICLSFVASGSFAYFTAEKQTHNVITSGSINIALLEWADKGKTMPFPKKGISDVMPGSKITKIVEVKNTGANGAFVRVKVKKAIALAGKPSRSANTALIHLDFNRNHWTLEKDGYFYYKSVLKPGETTAPLFNTVTFSKAMDNLYQHSVASIDVMAYATQAANNGTSAVKAHGWPKA